VIVVSLLLILVSGGLLATGILQANDPFVMASIGVSVLAAAALFLGIRQQRGGVDRYIGQDAGRPARDEYRTAGATSTPLATRTHTADAGRGSPAGSAVPVVGAATVRPPAAGMARPPATRPVVGSAAAPVVGSASVSSVPRTAETAGPAEDAAASDGETPRSTPDEVTATQVIDVDVVAPARKADETAESDDTAEPDEPDEPAELDESAELDDEEDPPDEPAAELLMASEESRLAELDSEVLVVDGRPRYHLAGCPHLADKESQPLPISEAVELGFTACSLCGAASAVLAEATAR